MVNAIRALEAISTNQPIGLSQLARELTLSKATVLRILSTLREMGWVEQDSAPSAHWSLTFHAYAVAARTGMGLSIRDMAVDPMSALQSATGETIHLCLPDGRNMIVAERVDSSHALRAFMALGTALQMHASGTGLAYLASASDNFIDLYLEQPLEARTKYTLTSPEALKQELQQIRMRGYSINIQGRSEGITSLGAAILNASSSPIASVSISGPTSRITEDRFQDFGQALLATAHEISNRAATLR